MTPAAILANALTDLGPLEFGPLSMELGIPRPQIARAAHGAAGQATRADYHLKLCAWLGIHPVTGAPAVPHQHIRFDAPMFALAVRMARFRRCETTAEAAQTAGVSAAVLNRIQDGDIRSFESTLAACLYGDLNPLNYVVVSRETSDQRSAA